MKPLWQLTHDELTSGALALTRCPRCLGEGAYNQTIGAFDGDNLIETQQRVACDCRTTALALLAAANLPPGRFDLATLGSLDWPAIQPAKTRVTIQLYAERLPDMLASGIGLTLTGDVGTGKTHVAIGLIKLACAMNIPASFHTMPALLASLKATYNRDGHRRTHRQTETGILDHLATTPLLALDDLGVEQPTDWMRDRLYTLINRRYTAQLPTIVTANQPLPSLAGRLGKRCVSRLAGASIETTFNGPDHRPHTRDQLLSDLGMAWTDIWEKVQQ